jgi:hypothetical protein
MTFTEQEIKERIAQLAQRDPLVATLFVQLVQHVFALGHLNGVQVSLEHTKNKFDRKRLLNLITDARKAL